MFVCLFVCFEFFVPLENFSLIWRRHHCRLEILTSARHLSCEGSLACFTYCDTGHPFIMVISSCRTVLFRNFLLLTERRATVPLYISCAEKVAHGFLRNKYTTFTLRSVNNKNFRRATVLQLGHLRRPVTLTLNA